jgi:NADH:ubiquinone oxidoreductase subunit 6 (subunit J)
MFDYSQAIGVLQLVAAVWAAAVFVLIVIDTASRKINMTGAILMATWIAIFILIFALVCLWQKPKVYTRNAVHQSNWIGEAPHLQGRRGTPP